MAPTDGFVLIGAGMAGAKTAESLRKQGFDGRITLIGDEPHRPYERPPLSKDYLAGRAAFDHAYVHGPDWYAEQRIDLRLRTRATHIDRSARQVQLSDGDRLDYDKLLIATGAQPRSLPIPGVDTTGEHYLRRVGDSDRIKETLARQRRLVVIGAGWIGLEVTAAAREAGVSVTVIDNAELPLLRVLGPEVAKVFAGLHRDHDVDFRFGSRVGEIITGGGRTTGVRLTNGTEVSADAVLVAIGIEPDVALARDAGLAVDNGIIVDSTLRTSDPDIFAAGDVANAFHPLLDKRIRVEHWANALNQPGTAASSMLGRDAHYAELPYFFTDQYDLGMEYLGYTDPGDYDEVVFRGNVAAREFIAFWVKDGRVLAGMNVNVWGVTDVIKDLITSGVRVDTERLADTGRPLTEFSG